MSRDKHECIWFIFTKNDERTTRSLHDSDVIDCVRPKLVIYMYVLATFVVFFVNDNRTDVYVFVYTVDEFFVIGELGASEKRHGPVH